MMDQPSLDSTPVEMNSTSNYSVEFDSLSDDEKMEIMVTTFKSSHQDVEAVICGFIFLIGFSANCYSFYRYYKMPSTRFNQLIKHVIFNDILVMFCDIFYHMINLVLVRFHGGLVICKISAFFKAFPLYASSNILVCLAIDRYYSILNPFSVLTADERIKRFLIISYAAAVIFSMPQASETWKI